VFQDLTDKYKEGDGNLDLRLLCLIKMDLRLGTKPIMDLIRFENSNQGEIFFDCHLLIEN
jgi:hypothetical protein